MAQYSKAAVSRVRAKLGTAPTRTSLNVTGDRQSRKAAKPVAARVTDSLRSAMGSGDGGPGVGQASKVSQGRAGQKQRTTKTRMGSFDGVKFPKTVSGDVKLPKAANRDNAKNWNGPGQRKYSGD